ncbi:MAG: hypothetical protein KF901_29395, partial [Myxococcales bacterium]|nr:hypothetical protein [Myxococcales bacterium]
PGGLGQRSWRAPVARLVGAIGGVLVADAGSQLRFTGCALALDGGEAVMRTERGRALLDADLVVQLGESPLGSGFAAWAKGRDRVVIAEGGWPDPEGDAALFAFGDVEGALEALAAQLAETTPRPPERTPDLRGHLEAAVAAARADALEGPLSQPAAVRAAVEACPEGAALVLGNSLPIRAVDLYVGRDVALDVVVQRGLSGIDGFVAGSAAHARASARPTLAVLGDVTFAHDLGSLLLARGLDSPLVFFVPNDGGGRIFEQLPVHEVLDAAAFERHFAMDHGLSFDGAAALYGLRYVRASAEAEIRAAVAEGLERPGATIVEAKVPPESARLVGRRFVAALGARLGGAR